MTPQELTAWREASGGRKFWLCVGCALINTVLFGAGILSESGYLMIIGGTVFTYLGVRTTTAIANKEAK